MPAKRIRILIADDIADTRESISKLLFFERDMEIVGFATNGQEAVDAVRQHHPDIVMMDITMPVMDGVTAAEAIRSMGTATQVIMMSVQEQQDYLRQAMLAGAREFLVKPFSGEQLARTIRVVNERATGPSIAPATTGPSANMTGPVAGQIITVFGPKGGVGKTTVATNLAVALKMVTQKRVAIVDCNLQFGDVGVLLNMQPTKTIIDWMPHVASLDSELLRDLILTHSSGIDVVLAPTRPEMSELVTIENLKRVVTKLAESYDYVVVDTAPSFSDLNVAMLDISDRILGLLTLEMPAIKDIRLFLEVAHALGYPKEKVIPILNRSTGNGGGIQVKDIEASFGRPFAVRIPNDWSTATFALNHGTPFVVLNRNTAISRAMFEISALLAGGGSEAIAGADGHVDDNGKGRKTFLSLPWRKETAAAR